MKTTPQKLLLIITLTLGFSQLALSNSNLQKTAEQGILGDSTEIKTVNSHQLLPSVYQHENEQAAQLQTLFKKLQAAGDEILELTLTTDLQNLIVNKNKEEYQKAYLEGKDQLDQIFRYELKVKARGKYRRKICDFPPLKLNFDKDDLEAEGLFGDFDKLKLVTHCTDIRTDAKDNVLREYLTYKMYNTLTDNSFRVILVKIKYIDLHNSMKSVNRYGFIIENNDEMGMRLNGEICDCHGLRDEMVAQKQANLTAMFQYMIGNEDWSINMLRNVKAVNLYSGPENIIVPYDFDFSGVVNAPYAVPDRDLKHTKVVQRHFFGAFADYDEYQKMADYYLSKKSDILDLIKRSKYLSFSSKLEISEYIKEFYATLEDQNMAKEVFFKDATIQANK